jgi:multiple sugar transport system substrate-binding protein
MKKIILLAVAVMLFLCTSLTLTAGGKDKEEGPVSIRVIGLTDPGITAESELAKEFIAETGIEVIYETYDWSGFVEKTKLEFANPTGSYDILEYDALMSFALFPNDSLIPLKEFIDDPDLPDINVDGFVGRLVDFYGTWQGQVVGVPRSAANRIYAYRKDLFEDPKEKADFKKKYGYELKFPETWKQYRDVAEFFTRDTDGDGEIDFWGTGQGFSADGDGYDQFSDIFRSYNAIKDGKWFLDKDMKPIFNGKQGVEALELLVDIVQGGFVSPGYNDRLWVEETTEMGSGRVAMAGTYSELFATLLAEEYAGIRDRVGYAELPRMERKWTILSSMNYGISRGSKHPKEAYRYLTWLLSEKNDVRLVTETEGGKMPCRESSYENSTVRNYIPFAEVQAKTHSYADPWPQFVEFEEMMVYISIAVQEAIEGDKTAKQALDDAAAELYGVLEKAGYYD